MTGITGWSFSAGKATLFSIEGRMRNAGMTTAVRKLRVLHVAEVDVSIDELQDVLGCFQRRKITRRCLCERAAAPGVRSLS